MIVSLLYQVTRKLLSATAVLLRRHTARDAELLVLRHESGATPQTQGSGPLRSGGPVLVRCPVRADTPAALA
ncbi:hypothetical protein [Saccharopolyspora shandongensis]|uniref:hypothetical protein n=1 Tax=Saccharopolyspora shandongensis TaxID=418495 RepID=UPI001C42EBFF|nr:hypothetical protein [Saccharopolyspora shandongensis]